MAAGRHRRAKPAGAQIQSNNLNDAYLLIASCSPQPVAIAPDINVLSDFACVLASLLDGMNSIEPALRSQLRIHATPKKRLALPGVD